MVIRVISFQRLSPGDRYCNNSKRILQCSKMWVPEWFQFLEHSIAGSISITNLLNFCGRCWESNQVDKTGFYFMLLANQWCVCNFMFSLNILVSNTVVTGVGRFQIKNISVSLLPPSLTVAATFPALTLSGTHSTTANYGDYKLNGTGNFQVVATSIRI